MDDPPSIMEETTRVKSNGEVWRVVAIACISMMVGAGSEWFFRGRDTLTKDDLNVAIAPIQRQLDDLTRSEGLDTTAISDIKASISALNEHNALLDRRAER
jgi:hypothetical protein